MSGTDPTLREYPGCIWVGNDFGIGVQVVAGSSSDARAQVIAEYGEGHVISVWNEEQARRLR